jgi:quercetin dioxygenase-like cupin family protein
VFVVLDGEGTLELRGPPKPGEALPTEPQETHEVKRGHIVSRPAGTRTSHCLRAGDHGLTYLAFGTKEPNELIARLEPLDYFDGEPS